MIFKTQPWPHQRTGLQFLDSREHAGLFMEQRTGKTKVILDDVARLYDLGRANSLVVVAPNGVHTNWVLDEIPTHLPDHVARRCAWWESSPRKSVRRALDDLMDPAFDGLRVLTVNFEALNVKRAWEYVRTFLNATTAVLVVDESTRIKNHRSGVTKALMKLRDLARYRRILNGTPATEGPLDLYAQLAFIHDDALPVGSYVGFSHRYAEFLPASDPLVQRIMRKGARWTPKIQATTADGKPIYKNLDELRDHVSQWCYRVTRRDVRKDMPEKMYKRWFVDVPPAQDRAIRNALAAIKAGDTPEPVAKLNAVMYYQRLLCGWMPPQISGANKLVSLFDRPLDNPRVRACVEIAESYPDESIIFWSRFTEDIRTISSVLKETYGEDAVVEYYGDVSNADREVAKRRFQAGEARFFVGQAQAGGVGLPLYRAGVMVYYSNDFKLYLRLQSEDRAEHMEMTRGTVVIDIEAPNTLDTRLIATLRGKRDVADAITGDDNSTWLEYE